MKVQFEVAIFEKPLEKHQQKSTFSPQLQLQARNYAENALLQMFFQELGQNLQNSYFKKLFLMYRKQKPVEYSPSVVL